MKKMLVVLNIIFLALMFFLTLKIIRGNYDDFRIVIVAILAYFAEAIVFLYSFLYIPDRIKIKIGKLLNIYLIVVGLILVSIALIQWITGWTFILYLNYRFIIYAFFIYPAILKLFLKLISYYDFKENIFLTGLVSFVVILIMGINGLFFGFDMRDVSMVSFDNPEVELVLVADKGLWSSSHSLYVKENALFVSQLQGDRSWSCNDFCVIGDPDVYHWVWLDADTLEVSGGGLLYSIIFNINEA
jgi:hypothetical protein